MRSSRVAWVLLAMSTFAICLSYNPNVSGADTEEASDTLQQRVATLETQIHQLRQLVVVLQAERLRDMLPVQQSAIIGEWIAKTDIRQTITLSFHSNGTFDIAARGVRFGSVHGTGTWKLNEMQVVCSYQYNGQDDLPKIKLPLDMISKDAMAFAGVVYRRSPSSDLHSNPRRAG